MGRSVSPSPALPCLPEGDRLSEQLGVPDSSRYGRQRIETVEPGRNRTVLGSPIFTRLQNRFFGLVPAPDRGLDP